MSTPSPMRDECAPLVELNLDCLRALHAAAQDKSLNAAAAHPVLAQLQPLWCTLGSQALERLARAPFALLDAEFGARVDWLQPTVPGVRDASAVREPACFDAAIGRMLLRRLLAYGWHVARSQPRAARLLLGCDGAAVSALGACSLGTLDAVADLRGHELRLRWARQLDYWRELLTTAQQGSEPKFNERLLHAVRRVAADALRAQTATSR